MKSKASKTPKVSSKPKSKKPEAAQVQAQTQIPESAPAALEKVEEKVVKKEEEEEEDNEWSDLIDSVEKPEKALDFFLAPLTLERLILFGSLISADSFLFTVAFLPFRAVWGLLTGKFLKSHAARIDIARLVLILSALLVVPSLDINSMSSLVKKSELKLKLVWATLEFLNGMLTDWNATILGSFFWALSPSNAGRRRYPLILHYVISVGYLALHTTIITLYLGVINLAITTSDRAFLGLIFIVQFAEMKSAATKSMSREKILNECTDDITERFQTLIYVILLFICNFDFVGPLDLAVTKELISDLSIVYLSELAVDNIKHTSILCTNGMSPAIYTAKNHELMAGFVKNSSPAAIFGDKSTKTSRSMGFCAIPVAVVTFKMLVGKFAPGHGTVEVLKVLGVSWVVFVALKVVLFAVSSVVARITVFTPIERFFGISPEDLDNDNNDKKEKKVKSN